MRLRRPHFPHYVHALRPVHAARFTLRVVTGNRVLIAITTGGFALRCWAALTHGRHESADQHAYALLGLYLSERGHYGGPALTDAFHWPPGAPALFALLNLLHPGRLAPLHPEIPMAYAGQVVAGTATIVLAALLARRVVRPWAGELAAVLVAGYPPLVLSAGELLSEPLGAALLAGAVLALARAIDAPTPRRCVLCGLLLGLTALTRADLVAAPLVPGILVAALLWRRFKPGRSMALGALLPLGSALAIAPWGLFAHHERNHFVLVTSGSASNFFVGTYLPGHGTIFGLKHALGPRLRAVTPGLRHTPDFRLKATTVLRFAAGGHRGSRGNTILLHRAWHDLGVDLTRHPSTFAGTMADKIGRLWLDYTHGTLGRSRPLLRAGHVLLVALALAGLLAGLLQRRSAVLVAVAALALYATVVNAVLISEARHLLPFLPLLFAAGAAGGVAWLVRDRAT